MPKKTRLGVNIDHIATLRQARKETFPSPLQAAKEALKGGADGIVCHLREDRRHIQEADVWALKKLGCRLDLEMALTDEMVDFALRLKPQMVTLVPEKREEVTTEGGLDVTKWLENRRLNASVSKSLHGNKLETATFSRRFPAIQKLQAKGIIVSLFIDPEEEQIRAAAESGARYIEIHTGAYANSKTPRHLDFARCSGQAKELDKIREMAALAARLGLKVNAGHGLDYYNVYEIARIPEVEELNIGFSIIAQSVFVGMQKAARQMRFAMKGGKT